SCCERGGPMSLRKTAQSGPMRLRTGTAKTRHPPSRCVGAAGEARRLLALGDRYAASELERSRKCARRACRARDVDARERRLDLGNIGASEIAEPGAASEQERRRVRGGDRDFLRAPREHQRDELSVRALVDLR